MDTIKKGDMLWVSLKGPTNDYGYGEVTEVWFDKESKIHLFNFHCLVNGGLRMGRSDQIINKPTIRMTSKYAQARKEYAEIMKLKK